MLALFAVLGFTAAGCEHAKLAHDNRSGGNLTGYGSGRGYGDGTSTGADYATLDKAADRTSEQRNHEGTTEDSGTTLRSKRASSSLPNN